MMKKIKGIPEKEYFRKYRDKVERIATSPDLAREIRIIAAKLGIPRREVKPEHFKSMILSKPKEDKFNFKL